jgi:4a-hydroxytetrahydrobiopterin dehydratase
MAKLTAAQIRAVLPTVPGWKRQGRVIARTYQFRDFAQAMKFVNTVARLAERAWHHPDFTIQWSQVTLTLTTHDAAGLTEKDFVLAGKLDALAKPKARS